MMRICPYCREIIMPNTVILYLDGNSMKVEKKYECSKCGHLWNGYANVNKGNVVCEN
jgi:hypothetical protein